MKDKIQLKVTTCVPQMSYFALNSSKIASFWGLRPQTLVASGPPANIFGIRPHGPPLHKIPGAPLPQMHKLDNCKQYIKKENEEMGL